MLPNTKQQQQPPPQQQDYILNFNSNSNVKSSSNSHLNIMAISSRSLSPSSFNKAFHCTTTTTTKTTDNSLSQSQLQLQQLNQKTTTPNPSKIFRIEHLLPKCSNNATQKKINISLTKSSSKSPVTQQQRPGVYVMQFTPKHTKTQAIATESLISKINCTDSSIASIDNNGDMTSKKPELMARAHCIFDKNKQVLMITPEIMRKIKLAEDIQSHNALFEWHNGLIHLHIVRDLNKDEEIVAWFSEDILLLMAIPFLTPLNIQGNNRYTCHMCQMTFETPNPLKIHLALNCAQHSIDVLWLRLHYASKSRDHINNTQLITSAILTDERSAVKSRINVNTTDSATSTIRYQMPSTHLSAFKPIVNVTPATIKMPVTMPITNVPDSLTTTPISLLPLQPYLINTPLLLPSSSSSLSSSSSSANIKFIPNILPHMSAFLQNPITTGCYTTNTITTAGTSTNMMPPTNNALNVAANAAAQIEAIVSNMGASKQGHLCIYCGKVYSRKYGLKIHIRTHTGFKPLKCKYCMRPFGDPSNLNKHVRLHVQANIHDNISSTSHNNTNIIPPATITATVTTTTTSATIDNYKCHLCQKIVARRRDLQRHLETRHGYGRKTKSLITG